MRTGAIPFKFDMSDAISRLRRLTSKHIGAVTLNLPGINVPVVLKDREKQIAREVVIRLKDRRVLTSWECCDGCIDQALNSLQEIRKFLVDKQVELADLHDGPLFVFIDAMASGIRQFLTFEQHLNKHFMPESARRTDFHRAVETRQEYFDALEILRGHLSRCLEQICRIAEMRVPKDNLMENYKGHWQVEAYEQLALPKAPVKTLARKR